MLNLCIFIYRIRNGCLSFKIRLPIKFDSWIKKKFCIFILTHLAFCMGTIFIMSRERRKKTRRLFEYLFLGSLMECQAEKGFFIIVHWLTGACDWILNLKFIPLFFSAREFWIALWDQRSMAFLGAYGFEDEMGRWVTSK